MERFMKFRSVRASITIPVLFGLFAFASSAFVSAASLQDGTTKGASDQAPRPKLRSSYYKCASSTEGVTWAMQKCIETEFVYQDGRLNTVYRKLRVKLSEPRKSQLRDEEKKWIGDKNGSCKWDAETEGQAKRIEANICSLKMTAARAEQLEGMIKEPEHP
jgi:uncharacterized protein YecT (DUF1311 family)